MDYRLKKKRPLAAKPLCHVLDSSNHRLYSLPPPRRWPGFLLPASLTSTASPAPFIRLSASSSLSSDQRRLPSLLSPLSSFRSSVALRHAVVARFPIARASFGSSSQIEADHYKFGPYKIDQKEVFYSTNLSYALVNLRPLLPGHILEQVYIGISLNM
ncbi:hypothetical protein L1887_36818 [Cichorium endivia]|nr:hypothetical protein L1887_36818 [Cichorium endivia]